MKAGNRRVVISDNERAYAAGLIDGEGCIDIHFNKPTKYQLNGQYFIRVTVHITNLEVLEWLQERWGGSILERKNINTAWRQSYDWKVVSAKARTFLKDISQFLIIKKAEAETALELVLLPDGQRLTPTVIQNRRSIMYRLQDLKHGREVRRLWQLQ